MLLPHAVGLGQNLPEWEKKRGYLGKSQHVRLQDSVGHLDAKGEGGHRGCCRVVSDVHSSWGVNGCCAEASGG